MVGDGETVRLGAHPLYPIEPFAPSREASDEPGKTSSNRPIHGTSGSEEVAKQNVRDGHPGAYSWDDEGQGRNDEKGIAGDFEGIESATDRTRAGTAVG
jgi:hypothetical protein